MPEEIAFACNLNALTPEQRIQHGRTTEVLFASVRRVTELPNGYAFELPTDALQRAADFIANERLCCPFFTFGLEVEANGGPIVLQLTGTDGIKPFIAAELPVNAD